MTVIDYSRPGPLTAITTVAAPGLPPDALAICRLAAGLVLHPLETAGLDLPPERFAENQIRAADAVLGAVLAADPAPLSAVREPVRRVIGTCRHFAVLTCALLRHRGIAARARCGFATYFEAGLGIDHWITEYHDGDRWVRVDPQILGGTVLDRPEDLTPGQFLTGGEAWALHRQGHIDAMTFGVHGTTNFGPAEIRGNAVRDLAALNKVEMLPWDEWGRMEASYAGATGPDYDTLMDRIAAVCATGDEAAIAGLYHSEDLTVPAALI